MSVRVFREPKEREAVWFPEVAEECFRCFKRTRFWTGTDGKAVACCEKCVKVVAPSDIPSKRDWIRAARRRAGDHECCGGNSLVGHFSVCRSRA